MDLSDLQYPKYHPFAYKQDDPFSSALKNLDKKFMELKLPDSKSFTAVEFYFPHEITTLGSSSSLQNEFLTCNTEDISLIPGHPMQRAIKMPDKKAASFLMDFNGEWINKIPPMKVSTSNIQLAKTDPWDEVFKEWDSPKDSILENASVLSSPLLFQDPLKQDKKMLLPIPENPVTHYEPWNPEISIIEEEIQFPDVPSLDYLLKLVPTDISSETDEKIDEKEGKVDDEQDLLSTGDKTTQGDSQLLNNMNFISTDMPENMWEMVETLEWEANACFKTLVGMNQFPSCINDLKGFKSIGDMQPQTTRSYLLILEKEMNESDYRDTHRELKRDHQLQHVLQLLLKLHGLNKTLHTLKDYGYQQAYDVLYEFQQKHHRNLKVDFKPILYELANLKARQKNIHPKLLEIRQLVLDHLLEGQQRKVWIHLQHRRKEIQPFIAQLLIECGVECVIVDPKYLCDDRKSVFLSASMPTNFPMHILTLVIHYDWPSLLPADVKDRLRDTPRYAILIRRPQPTGNEGFDASESNPSKFEEQRVPASESADEMTSDIERGNEENCIQVIPDSGAADEQDPTPSETEDPQPKVENSIPRAVVPVLVVSAHILKHLNCETSQSENVQITVLDYSFLGKSALYQPDILVDPITAVLVLPFSQLSNLDDLRLRIRMISFKCSKCWIVVVLDDARQLRQPELWSPLTGLITYYRRAGLRLMGYAFELKLRIAHSFSQVVPIATDISLDVRSENVDLITPPVFDEATRLLLHIPFLNALTAEMAACSSILAPLIRLPSRSINVGRELPDEITQRLRVLVDSISKSKQADGSPEITSSFGRLKIVYEDSGGRETPGLFHTPKRLKLQVEEPASPTSYSVNFLINSWD